LAEVAQVRVYLHEALGQVNPNIYGHFIEHLGRCIYGGVWAAEKEQAKTVRGYRQDVLEAVKALKPPVLRYPGGCFSDGYHWKDGIGPADQRPTVFDQAWKAQEPNAFGTDEFLRYCEIIGAAPYINVNFGSGTVEEAVEWLHYCHAAPSTAWGSQREANGHPQPYFVPYWGIGNEICLPGEIGHTDAETYAKGYLEFVKAMKAVDPRIKCVAVGWDETIPDWNAKVVETAGPYIDYLSIHHYVPGEVDPNTTPEALYYAITASPLSTQNKLIWAREIIQTNLREPARIDLALDEWNVWLPSPPDLSQEYKLRDGLYAAAMFHVLQRLSASVTMANLAQLVNVLGAIKTAGDQMLLTPIYWAFRLYAPRTGRIALLTEVECDTYDQPQMGSITALNGVPYLDASATIAEDDQTLYLGVVNRHWSEEITARVDLGEFEATNEVKVCELNGPGPLAENTFANPNVVGLTERTVTRPGATLEYTFPAHSATVLELRA